MIPTSNGLIEKIVELNSDMPSRTFKIIDNRIVGFVEEEEALAQAIDLILRTERCEFAIFSSEYGTELQDLFLMNEELFDARLEMRIEDALLADVRINSISDFELSRDKTDVYVSFTVNSVYGEISYERKM
ncbi:MAG: DUF2634 domain-containing protein [Clostridia bacterium]